VGEYADDALFAGLDSDDPFGEYNWGWARPRRRRRKLFCQYCGEGGFHWVKRDGHWRLGYTDKFYQERVHDCPELHGPASADDFE
jgi:hypothetical protein